MAIYDGYECFVPRLEEIEEGEIELRVRDCSKYKFKRVKAKIARDRASLPDGENLWIRDMIGRLFPHTPWTIKIVQEIEDR